MLKVNGREIVIEGTSPEDVLSRVSLASMRRSNRRRKARKPSPRKQPALSQDELFKIGQSLQQGKIEAIDEYIEKSGLLERLLEKKGLTVADLKETVSEGRSSRVVTGWQSATEEFKTSHPEYVPTPLNMKLMGYKIAELNLANKPSFETLEKVYESCKADGYLQSEAKSEEIEKKEPPKKKAQGSSIFGTGQNRSGTSPQRPDHRKTETELEKLTNRLHKGEISTQDYISGYNSLVAEAGPQA